MADEEKEKMRAREDRRAERGDDFEHDRGGDRRGGGDRRSDRGPPAPLATNSRFGKLVEGDADYVPPEDRRDRDRDRMERDRGGDMTTE